MNQDSSLWKIWGKTLQNKLIFTKMNDTIVTALFENNRCMQLEFETKETSLLGNLYIGKVKNIAKNIQAAFVEIAPGKTCYLSLDEAKNPVYTSKTSSKDLVAQDELLVQVKKESMKTKNPGLTANFSLTGQYLVLTHGNTRIGFSSKLDEKTKRERKEWILPYANERYGWIVRTNAKEASKEEFLFEAEDLAAQYDSILQRAKFRTCYSVLKRSDSLCIETLKNVYHKRAEEIVTDQKDLYEEICAYEEKQPPDQRSTVTFYQDTFLTLTKLYNLERELERALKERVWLKSGAYLVIQPTEALTVIDVNTGKNIEKRTQQQNFLRINKEAAVEIARQIRLRNLSGIIIVDFVNMDTKEARDELMNDLESLLNHDPIKTTLVDMTRLGLVEITRKKRKRPLFEQIGENFFQKAVDGKTRI